MTGRGVPREPVPTFSVPELAEAIRMAMTRAFPEEVWVRGEIAGLNRAKNGHVYFSLIEPHELGRGAAASLSVALLADRRYVVNQILRRQGGAVRMSDGVEIRLRARIDFYAPNGRLSLLMTLIDPDYTLGRLLADRDRLLRTLAAEELLERQARLPLSPAPMRIALVTSSGSAAEHDVLAELRRGGYGFEVRTFHTVVQGSQAPESVVRALHSAQRHGSELILLVRGGGARTDLAAFDAELVARAIAASPVPVWTGIGHEIDRAVADEVAQRAFKTPTACAAALVGRVEEFMDGLDRRWQAIAALAGARLETAEHDLRRRRSTLERDGRTALRLAERSLGDRATQIAKAARRSLDGADARMVLATARVASADPQRVLARGFTLTRRAEDGRVVRGPADVTPGDRLVTLTAAGNVHSEVTAGPPDNTPTPPQPRRRADRSTAR